jgi:NADH-quinone oxidoreductase subunit K
MTEHARELLQFGVAAGVGLVVLGLGGMILRRSILVVVMSGALAILGCALVLVVMAAARGDPKGIAVALFLILIAAAWSLAGAAVALTTYRRRGTENVDELRELRG